MLIAREEAQGDPSGSEDLQPKQVEQLQLQQIDHVRVIKLRYGKPDELS